MGSARPEARWARHHPLTLGSLAARCPTLRWPPPTWPKPGAASQRENGYPLAAQGPLIGFHATLPSTRQGSCRQHVGNPSRPRRHRPPLLVRDGCSLLVLRPRSEPGEPHWAPVPHPHRGARAPCLLLSVRGQKGTSCRSQVVGSTCPRLRRPGAHALLPLSGLRCSRHVFRGPDGGKGGRCAPEARWGGHPGSVGPGACLLGARVLSGPGSGAAAAAGSAGEVHPAHVSLQAAPPMRGQEALLQASGWCRLSSPSGGVRDLGVWGQAGPRVPTGLLSSGRLLETRKDRCFSHCALRNPRETPGAGGEGPVDSPKGTGVGAG